MFKTTDAINNGANIIDSRDIIARLDELQSERDSATDEAENADSEGAWKTEDGTDVSDSWDEDQEAEYQTLKALADECEGYGDWAHGETLIRDTYFKTYAQDLAEDIGAISQSAQWPNNCIDWEQAADELKADYMQVEFDGVYYWMRA